MRGRSPHSDRAVRTGTTPVGTLDRGGEYSTSMALGIPSVVGPVCEWLDAVPVEGCWPGATVIVQTDDAAPTVVAEGTSGGGRDLVPVISGTRLRPSQRLVAMQRLPGESSVLTPGNLAVVVGVSPTSHTQLPPIVFRSKLYECGAAVWLAGAAPGAAVTVSVGGGVVGTGRADAAGDARLLLGGHLPAAGTTVTAVQSAPPGRIALTGLPQPLTGQTIHVPHGPLPPPVAKEPLPMGCESFVRIGAVIDGAAVTVVRTSDGMSETATFDLGDLWFRLSKPFPPEGDQIEVSQALPRCEIEPSRATNVDIRPAKTPDPLDVASPCAGSNYVHVAHLRPGATLTIAADGLDPLRYIVPAERIVWDVPVDALPAGKNVTVTLTVCGFSISSTVPIVDDEPPPRPEVVERLYRCGRAVSIRSRAGAYLELWADHGAGPTQISPRVRAHRDLETLGVFPYLTIPESVWGHQLSCGGGWLDSPPADVLPHPDVEPLELREPVEDQRAVLPTNVVSGAHVVVTASSRAFGGQEIIGERDVTKADPVVGLGRRLTTDDEVWAIQELCGERSEARWHYPVTQGVKHFVLPAPIQQSSGLSTAGTVVVHSAEFVCRFLDGSWILFADTENTEPGYDCSLVLGVDLNLPAPLIFGENLDIDEAAANEGLPSGLYSLGYPSRSVWKKTGKDSLLQNRAMWIEVLTATANWKILPAWRNYAPGPDKPEWVNGDHAPPDPNQLFPPLPTDDV